MMHLIIASRRGLYLISFFLLLNTAQSENKYHSYDEMTKVISSLVSSHKDIANTISIGKTLDQRDIWAITVGEKDADNRHAILIVGGVEADRIIGSELTLNFLNFLLNNYGKVDTITQLLKTTTFYFLPRVNPDASEAFFQKPLYARTFNAHPIDDDKDGIADEDGLEDLNDDGMITIMRVRDNRGEWIPNANDTRLMKKADLSKGEHGMYKLLTEGIDNDKDEQWNEDEPGGVDFNRNFPHNYRFFSKGAGSYQLSEIETRAVADFCFSHSNIAVVFTFSSNDNLMNPWKKEPRQGPPVQQEQRSGNRRFQDDDSDQKLVSSVMDDDEQYYNYISKQYQGITNLKGAPQSTKGEGAFSEWAYYQFGRWSFAVNPWWIPEIEQTKVNSGADSSKKIGENKGASLEKPSVMKPVKATDESPDEYADQIKALKWIDANNIKDGFVNWTKIKHKDFPDNEVEVGGFKPYVTTNPPTDSIDILAAKQNKFLAWLGNELPSIEIQNVKVESIDSKIFRLSADIANNGFLPTNSAMGDKLRWSRNVKVTLDLSKDQSLGSGKTKIILDPISGNGGHKEISWLIVSRSGETIKITAESPTAGKTSKTITLK